MAEKNQERFNRDDGEGLSFMKVETEDGQLVGGTPEYDKEKERLKAEEAKQAESQG